MKPFLAVAVAVTLASASAFAPIAQSESPRTRSITLHATTTSRRQLLHNALGGGAASSAAVLALLAAAPPPARAAVDPASYATALEASTNALSQSLGHALLGIDGMNAQARRLGSSPAPSHPAAVLDGLTAQARRLTRDLDRSRALLDDIRGQAREITIDDEGGGYAVVVRSVAHASSVLEGIVAQSQRLEGASTATGSTNDQIIYMLSVLDGLNAQVRRLDVGETFGVLDELNAKAATALL